MCTLLKRLAPIVLLFALREAIIFDPCVGAYPLAPGVALCIPAEFAQGITFDSAAAVIAVPYLS